MMKLVVTEPCARTNPTLVSIPVGSVFKSILMEGWYLKLREADYTGQTAVWDLRKDYLTFFTQSAHTFVQLANSVEVRVTP